MHAGASVSRGKTLLQSDMPKLAMRLDADLLAHIQHGTGGTVWKGTGANMLAEGDEQSVDLNPIAAREFGLKLPEAFFQGSKLLHNPSGWSRDGHEYPR